MDRSDAELLAASSGDAGAFRILYERYAAGVYELFRRRTGSRDDALDLTAETFAQAWISRDRFEDRLGGTVAPWLFGIARNVLRRSVRTAMIESSARARLGMLGEATRVAPALEDWLDGLDAALDAALAGLPSAQQHAVVRRVVHGHDYADIAAELGCSPTAVRIKVSRGLASLRSELEDEGHG